MSETPVVVEFFYNLISPYSYLGFEIIHRYKPIWNIDLKLKPVNLGDIMKRSGNKPPGVVFNKMVYLGKDIRRVQEFYQVPLIIPEKFMDVILSGGVPHAQRFITAVDIVKPEYLENISRALWKRLFIEHTDLSKAESFKEAAESISMEKDTIDKCLELMNGDEVEQRLKKYTDEAMDYGAFGAPMMVAHIDNKPEVFFGSDRFELMAHILGKKYMGPVPK